MNEPAYLDLGRGHRFLWVGTFNDEPTGYVHDSKPVCGVIEEHLRPDGEWCGGFLTFKGAGSGKGWAEWTVESLDPLTLSPSVLCRKCGMHGYIRNGQWADA